MVAPIEKMVVVKVETLRLEESSVFKMMLISSSLFDNLDVWYMITSTFSWRLTQFPH